MVRTVCITRHGNRLDFVDSGWFKTAPRPYDPPLSADGVVQARELGERLRAEHIARIFCSPFLRSVQTAHEVAEVLDLSIWVEAGLCEWLNPDWFVAPEFVPPSVLAHRFPRIDPGYESRCAARYPETQEQALARAGETAQRLVSEFSGNILLVGHGASVLGATAGLLRRSPEETSQLLQPIHYCCLVKLVRGEAQQWVMELNGTTAHLSRTEGTVRFA